MKDHSKCIKYKILLIQNSRKKFLYCAHLVFQYYNNLLSNYYNNFLNYGTITFFRECEYAFGIMMHFEK